MYHCHVEAAEHMQMGMVGNLYVHPAQNGTDFIYNNKTYSTFAYNDGDGSTGYDADYPIQIGSFDSAFHNASRDTQPLPFAMMADDYPMLNGRGYPDTINPGNLAAPPDNGGKVSQFESSLITANAGDRVLLRLSNLNVTRTYTLGTMGISMNVVGKDARILRGPAPDFNNLYYQTNSVTIGPGESYDVILDIPDGSNGNTYFLYTTNLNYLVNSSDSSVGLGGMMTEIQVNL
jgi:FtsP/CotA-like multicopper oxidase with cupredoxin domain